MKEKRRENSYLKRTDKVKIHDRLLLFLEYARVLRMLGNGRLEAYCFDGVKRLCHIRGKMRKKVWVATGDIVLVGLREYQDAKADVILKYNPDEARNLKAYKEIPDNAKINEGGVVVDGEEEEEDCAFSFDEI